MSLLDQVLADKVVGVVTWLGTIAGAIGLYVTFRQARSARLAAEAAHEAINDLESRVSIGALAYAHSQLGVAKDLVQSGDIRSAQAVFNPIKRAVLEACGRISTGERLWPQVEVTRRNLNTVDLHLGRGIQDAGNYNASKLTKSLDGIATFVIESEQEWKFPKGARADGKQS